MSALVGLVSFLAGFLVGSLVEYWGHRLMHRGVLLARTHARHHAENRGKGVLPEFLHYLLGTCFLLPLGFLVSIPAGWGWLGGTVLYAFFSAYGHQLQHDNPARCFWMPRMPVHHVHHRDGLHDRNFGLAVDWWDRVFGTYELRAWETPELLAGRSRPLWDLRWW
jgi:sterol desaturase/sphingolipid hydroxylase (fatty acid hydroxylase superfamily)